MKRTFAVISAFAALITVQAPVQAVETGNTLISMQNVNEGDVTVGVPTVRRADGSVCVGYISQTSYDDQSELRDIRIARICGPAQNVSHVVYEKETVQTPNTATAKN